MGSIYSSCQPLLPRRVSRLARPNLGQNPCSTSNYTKQLNRCGEVFLAARASPCAVRRILAARNEKQAMAATLWFNIAHYALKPWPWILVALASLIVCLISRLVPRLPLRLRDLVCDRVSPLRPPHDRPSLRGGRRGFRLWAQASYPQGRLLDGLGLRRWAFSGECHCRAALGPCQPCGSVCLWRSFCRHRQCRLADPAPGRSNSTPFLTSEPVALSGH